MKEAIIPSSDATAEEIAHIISLTRGVIDSYTIVLNDPDLKRAQSILELEVDCPVEYAQFEKRLGKAEAIRRGIAAALNHSNADIFVQIDGHLKQRPDQIAGLIALQAQEDSGLAIANRYQGVTLDSHRLALTHLFQRLNLITTGIDITDSVCGTRAYTRNFAHLLLAQSISIGYGIELEQIQLAAQNTVGISEAGVTSNSQANNTAAIKLVENLLVLSRYGREKFSTEQYSALNSLVYALLRFEDYYLNSSIFNTFHDMSFTYIANGEDDEPSYSLVFNY